MIESEEWRLMRIYWKFLKNEVFIENLSSELIKIGKIIMDQLCGLSYKVIIYLAIKKCPIMS